jgi:hypothetical protein
MSTRNRILSLTFATLALCGPAEAADEAVPVNDYTVFVDPPTGFVFVKLPAGWRFAGRLHADEIDKLPANVVTSLLKQDAGSGVPALTFSHAGHAPVGPAAAASEKQR